MSDSSSVTPTSTNPVPPTTAQKFAAETVGTFVLVFFGCGSVAYGLQISGNTLEAFSFVGTVGLAFGLAVMVMVYAFGRVSGGHFNPAVSVGAAMGGRMAWNQVPTYVAAQLGGAVLAGAGLFVLLHGYENFDGFSNNLGANTFGDQGSGYAWWAALLLEILLTALFVWVILAVTDPRNEHPALAPLAIGFTLAAIHFVAIGATGTSVNPARSIGPALFSGLDVIKQQWLFIVAPLVGGSLAGLTYPLLFGQETAPVIGSGLRFKRPHAAAVPGYGSVDALQQQWNQQAPGLPVAAAAPGPDRLQQEWNQPPAAADTWSAQGYAGQATGPATRETGAYPVADQQVTQTAGEQEQQPAQSWSPEPIIQDGWQWDYAAQEWKPLQQPDPQSGQQSGWTGPDDERTQIRDR